jgi:hypothetical protein
VGSREAATRVCVADGDGDGDGDGHVGLTCISVGADVQQLNSKASCRNRSTISHGSTPLRWLPLTLILLVPTRTRECTRA